MIFLPLPMQMLAGFIAGFSFVVERDGGFSPSQPTNIVVSLGYDVPFPSATSVPWTDPVVAITTNAQL